MFKKINKLQLWFDQYPLLRTLLFVTIIYIIWDITKSELAWKSSIVIALLYEGYRNYKYEKYFLIFFDVILALLYLGEIIKILIHEQNI